MLRGHRTTTLLLLLAVGFPLSACGSGGGAAATRPTAPGTPIAAQVAGQLAAQSRSSVPSSSVPGSSASRPAASAAGAATAKTTGAVAASGAAARLSAGNPDGHAKVPAAARAADTSKPDHVIGRGTPSGCSSAAVLRAVAAGGVTTFRCGAKPLTITLTRTAKVTNAHPDVVLDGGGLVTLSGAGKRRILYLNTCDQAQGWTTNHCNDQAHPRLTVQNLTFADGNSTGVKAEGGGGGAIFVRGGRLKVFNAAFVRNRCDTSGPDLGGAAVRVLDQAGGKPVYVVRSTFGGKAGQGGTCSNGGAISSIGVSWVVLNSLFTHNHAVGSGANPARSGTVGGGSGGAIYADGNTFTITLSGTKIQKNTANEGGGAVFFVSNDRTGTLAIRDSTLRANPSRGFETAGYPGIFFLGKGRPAVSGSVLT